MCYSILELLKYIDEHIDENITIETMCKLTGYSAKSLYNHINTITGKSIKQYIRERKLEFALKELLTGHSISDIAFKYGFDTPSGFYKAFVRKYHVQPVVFKKHLENHASNVNSKGLRKYEQRNVSLSMITIKTVSEKYTMSLWENIYSNDTPKNIENIIQENINLHKEQQGTQFIAVLENEVLGTMTIKKRKHVLQNHIIDIYDAVVNPAFQNIGIGTKLLNECEKASKVFGGELLYASCRNDVCSSFWAKQGFTIAGTIPNGLIVPWEDNTKYDELIFTKPLLSTI